MDDTNISKKDSNTVDIVITDIEVKFDKMVINRGEKHNFVGMYIELKGDGTVNILTRE